MRSMWKLAMMSISFVMMCVFTTRAQHFAFIESESQQPFFVKYNGGVISSTPSGFLMLSGILESSIEIVIGFPGAGAQQTQYRVAGLNRDRGFYLRKAERGEWVLMDRNDMSVIRGAVWEQTAPVAVAATATTVTAAAASPQLVPAPKPSSPPPATQATTSSKPVSKPPANQVPPDTKPKPKITVPVQASPPAAPVQQSTAIRSLLPLVSYLSLYEDDTYLARIYIERPGKGKNDTIIVEIDKRAKHPIRNRTNK